MRAEDLIYVVLLVGSLGLSAVLRACPSAYRASASAVAGAGLVLYACSWIGALHLLTALCLALGTCSALSANVRLRGPATLTCVFAHLCCVRCLPSFPGGATNAAMLVLALRLSSIGFDADAAAASTPELVRYALCYHGLFTAPYYSFGQWSAAMRSPQPLPPSRALVRVAVATVGALLFWQATAKMLPFSLAVSVEKWRGEPVWARPLFFYLSSYQYRWRFYACWLVMELSGLVAGFEQPANVSIASCERIYLTAHLPRHICHPSRGISHLISRVPPP